MQNICIGGRQFVHRVSYFGVLSRQFCKSRECTRIQMMSPISQQYDHLEFSAILEEV